MKVYLIVPDDFNIVMHVFLLLAEKVGSVFCTLDGFDDDLFSYIDWQRIKQFPGIEYSVGLSLG